jgi:hypothetical protein
MEGRDGEKEKAFRRQRLAEEKARGWKISKACCNLHHRVPTTTTSTKISSTTTATWFFLSLLSPSNRSPSDLEQQHGSPLFVLLNLT